MITLRPIRRMPARTAAAAVVAVVAVAMALAGRVGADSSPSTATFARIVDRSRLLVAVTVVRLDDALTVLRVDEAFKGSPPPLLTFPSDPTNVELRLGERALLSFVNDNLDFRAETIAWEIAADGSFDPGHLNPAPGMPPTLAALRAAFGRAPSDSGNSPSAAPPEASQAPVQAAAATGSTSGGAPPLALAAGAILAIVAGAVMLVLARTRRSARG